MSLGNTIGKLRANAKMSQEEFAELTGVSRQAVQKWEAGVCVPELDKLIKISKRFGVSLDALVFDTDARVSDELIADRLKPNYENLHDNEFFASNLRTEYRQAIDEGLDMEAYADVFDAVSRLPKDEAKKEMGDILFKLELGAKQREGYRYNEPSDLDGIKALRKGDQKRLKADKNKLEPKIRGAWMGRICGCLLGKTVEGIRTDELIPFLKETGNFPMHRYILRSDLNDDILNKYKYSFADRCYADTTDGMPEDDDTNYVVLAQKIIDTCGRDFTAYDVSRAWLKFQVKDAYCTAERVAYCNFVNGFEPPASAVYKNPFREWIGAQIRGDYYGYINPGEPESAADMAFRDASISHVKNGIYGEMFVSAMIAAAACTRDIPEIISAGLSQIPATSRLYEAVTKLLGDYEAGVSREDCFRYIHTRFDEHRGHDWCHTISNALIVTASLLYGKGDYGKSICMAVETGFDTDCNGATVGSVLGMAYGIENIDPVWTAPINDTLHTGIFGAETVKISDAVRLTLRHIGMSGK